jgi:hypothetical protein
MRLWPTPGCNAMEEEEEVRFEVLTAVLLKIQVFWNVTPCRWVKSF